MCKADPIEIIGTAYTDWEPSCNPQTTLKKPFYDNLKSRILFITASGCNSHGVSNHYPVRSPGEESGRHIMQGDETGGVGKCFGKRQHLFRPVIIKKPDTFS